MAEKKKGELIDEYAQQLEQELREKYRGKKEIEEILE